MPTELKSLIDAEAAKNMRSINAEVVARLQRSFEPTSDLESTSAGALIEEVIRRLGAHVQIVVSPEAAAKAGIGGSSKPKAKRRV